jgi:hypothetical protein
MPELQKEQSYHALANSSFPLGEVFGIAQLSIPVTIITAEALIPVGATHTTARTWVEPINRFTNRPVPHPETSPSIRSPELAEYLLTQSGFAHAKHLINILDELARYNSDTVYQIMSILKPYTQAIEEPNIDLAPISSTKITAKVIDRGVAEPDFSFE